MVYSEPYQTYEMEHFEEMFKLLTVKIFAKCSILGV